MEVESSTYTDFISCDRAGRRNAVHDIQREATTISMRKLTEDMGDLAVEGAGELPHAHTSKPSSSWHRLEGQARSGSTSDRCCLQERHTEAQEEHPIPHCFHARGCSGSGRLSRLRGAFNEQNDPWFLAQEHCTLQPKPFAHWCLNKACTDQDPSQSKLHIRCTLGFIKSRYWAGCGLSFSFLFGCKKVNL